MRFYITLLILIMLFTVTVNPHIARSTRVDCLYLLTLLDMVLEKVLRGDPLGEVMSLSMVKASVSGELQNLHLTSYDVLSDYYILLRAISNGSVDAATVAYRIHERLDTLRRYVDRLTACVHDVEAGKALKTSINSRLKGLEDSIYVLLRMWRQGLVGDALILNPIKDYYSPGECLEVYVSKDLLVEAIEVYVWPTTVRLDSITLSNCNTTYCSFSVEIPTAAHITYLDLMRYVSDRVLQLSLLARLQNGSYSLVGVIRVRYDLPRVQVSISGTIKRGSELRMMVMSDRVYNASVFVNGVKVVNVTLESGTRMLALDYVNYSLGLNNIRLCVDATVSTLPYCFDKVFVVEPLYPRVDIMVSNFTIAWLGSIAVAVGNRDNVDVHVAVDSGLGRLLTIVPGGQVVIFSIPTGFLPIQYLSVRVTVKAIRTPYDELEVVFNTYVVNVPLMALSILLPMLVLPFSSRYEKGFIIAITSVWKRHAPLVRRFEKVVSWFLRPYELGLNSRIAKLYYELLRRLKLRFPLLYETLREHFRDISKYLPERFRTLLWSMLVVVEKDLYSSSKPKLEDVVRIYKEIYRDLKGVNSDE